MEIFKAIVAVSLSPLVLTLVLQLLGWLLLSRHRRPALGLIMVGTVTLLLGSLGGWTRELRQSAQFVFPTLDAEDIPRSSVAIVVLGTGFNPDPLLPANSRVGGTFLARLLEGVRLLRARPDATLIVSIAGKAAESDKQQFWSEMQAILKLENAKVTLLTTAESTLNEAQLVQPLVAGKTVLLATSAGHMPRAVRIFTDEGMPVVAAPTDFGLPRPGTAADRRILLWLPTTDGLAGNQTWLYETVASLWQSLRGREPRVDGVAE
jgi:uncharacterized SAM-binding protein YcdF (DUF218 family)